MKRIAALMVAVTGTGAIVASLALGSPDRDDAVRAARHAETRLEREFQPKRGTVRIEARAADPGGAMPWAVRTWITHDERQACAQLGRVAGGRFVTVGADGQLREPRFHENTRCSGSALDRGEPIVAIQTIVDDPQAEEPRPVRTVVWGLAGPNARSVTIARGARARPRLSRRGGFVAVLDGMVRTYDVAVTVRRRDGRTHTLDYGRSRRRREQPHLDSVRLETTVPHPDGGARVGVLGWDDAGGRFCTYEGRAIAAGRVGSLEPNGVFFDFPVGEGGRCIDRSDITRELPFAYTLGYTAMSGGGEVSVQGITHPDVAGVRIDVLGQVREVEPTTRGVVIAIFRGVRSGDARITVTFRDGSTKDLEPLTFGDIPDSPGQLSVGPLGPHTIHLSRDGVATVEVTCPDDRRRRKCIGQVSLVTARAYRLPSGLRRHIRLGSRLFRIGEGTERRPLRIRLGPRGRALIARRGRLEADIVAVTDRRVGRRRRVTLLAPATGFRATLSSVRGDVSPRTGGLLTIFNVRMRAPASHIRRTAYVGLLRGPFGATCSEVRDLPVGMGARAKDRRSRPILRTVFSPRRLDPNEARGGDLGPWCPGRYRATISAGRPGGTTVGTFAFTVKGPGPGERVTVPNIVGMRKHEAECTLLRAHLRWRNGVGDTHPPRYRPRPGCQHEDVPGPAIRSQDPPAGAELEPGAVVTYETR